MNYSLKISALLLLAAFQFSYAQSLNHQWSFSIGDGEGGGDEVTALSSLSGGDLVAAGQFDGFIDFDPGPGKALGSSRRDDSYLARYSENGELKWFNQLTSDGDVYCTGIATDAAENIYLSGFFLRETDFDPENHGGEINSVTPNNADIFIAKYDSSGAFLWVKAMGSSGVDAGMDLEINSAGNIILAGHFMDTIQMDPGNLLSQHISLSSFDVVLASYDASGNYLWSKSIAGSSIDNARGVELDAADNIFLAGDFAGTLTFDNDLSTTITRDGGNDIFLAKLDPLGNHRWAQAMGGWNSDIPEDLVLKDSTLVITGSFKATAQFDPSGQAAPLSSGNTRSDIFVAAYDTSGNYRWAHNIGSTSSEKGLALTAYGSSVCVGGYYVGTVDFDPSAATLSATANSGAGFIASYNLLNGSLDFAAPFSGTSFNRVDALDVHASGKIWAGGYFVDSCDFDPIGPGLQIGTSNPSNGSSFFASYQAASGNADTAWTVTDRSGGNDEAVEVIANAGGNVLLAGNFRGAVDADPSSGETELVSAGGEDFFVAKYNSSGALSWARSFGGSGDEAVRSMAEDAQGNIYLAGEFSQDFIIPTGSGNDTLSSPYGLSLFLMQLDATGQVLWVHGLGGSGDDFVRGIAVSPNGKVSITGYFRGGADFDPALFGNNSWSAAIRDIFVATYDAAGNFEWAHQLGSTSSDYGMDAHYDQNGNLLITGSYRFTVDFDPGSGTSNLSSTSSSNDIFVAKYDSLGNYLWAESFGGTGSDYGYALESDGSGNIYLTGDFRNTVDFDPMGSGASFTSTAYDDIFVLSLNPGGDYRWVKTFGSSHYDGGRAISVYRDTVYSTGYFNDSLDFDPDTSEFVLVSQGSHESYLQVLDTAGNFLDAKAFGGERADYGHSLSANWHGLYLAGAFESSLDADPSILENELISAGDEDAYLIKLGQGGPCPPILVSQNLSTCDSAEWRGQVFKLSGTYFDTITAAADCDTIFQLNLNLSRSKFFQQSISACDSFDFKGQNITSSGIFYDTLSTGQGCDSIYSIDLTIHQSSYQQQSITACDSFPWRGQVLTASGMYYDTLSRQNGCDSVLALNLTLNQSKLMQQNLTTCDSLQWRGRNLTSSGTYFDTLSSNTGCDSILQLDLIVNLSSFSLQNVAACESFNWRGQSFFTSGIYYDSLSSSTGCDSVLAIDLTLSPSYFSQQSISACDSFLWRGQMLTASGIFYDSLISSSGCDSVLSLDLSLNQSSFNLQNVAACDSFQWRGQLLTSSGQYFDTLTASTGCDSILGLSLTINASRTFHQSTVACDSFAWQGQTLTSSGMYYDTLLTSSGCDSILSLNLTLNSSSINTQNISACGSYNWNGKVLTGSGTYYDSLSSTNGCDSVLILNLSLDSLNLNLDVSTTDICARQQGATYQWYQCDSGFVALPGEINRCLTPSIDGNYAAVITNGSCSDTSACLQFFTNDLIEPAGSILKIYPNPTTGQVNLEWKIPGLYQLEIYTAAGALVKKWQETAAGKTSLQLPGAKGVYHLVITNEEGSWSRQIIKQ